MRRREEGSLVGVIRREGAGGNVQVCFDRVRRRAWGLSGGLTASYILVTVVVVVLVEVLMLGFQVLPVVTGTRLQAQVDATAQGYARQLAQRYPGGVPTGTVLGDLRQPTRPGQATATQDGSMLLVPALTGPVRSDQAITAVVAVAADGTVVASSAPSRYPPGKAAASELPAPAAPANASDVKANGESTQYGTPYGSVVFMVSWLARHAAAGREQAGTAKRVAYVYVQAPWSPGFVNPVSARSDLGQLGYAGSLVLYAPAALLVAVVPVGVLFGLASWRLVRRVHRLERATLAVADGDYSVTLPCTGRDEVGRLEARFTTMTRQLSSALAAERDRATSNARDAERRISARGPRCHLPAPVRPADDRRRDAPGRPGQPAGPRDRAHQRSWRRATRRAAADRAAPGPSAQNGTGLAPALAGRLCARLPTTASGSPSTSSLERRRQSQRPVVEHRAVSTSTGSGAPPPTPSGTATRSRAPPVSH